VEREIKQVKEERATRKVAKAKVEKVEDHLGVDLRGQVLEKDMADPLHQRAQAEIRNGQLHVNRVFVRINGPLSAPVPTTLAASPADANRKRQ